MKNKNMESVPVPFSVVAYLSADSNSLEPYSAHSSSSYLYSDHSSAQHCSLPYYLLKSLLFEYTIFEYTYLDCHGTADPYSGNCSWAWSFLAAVEFDIDWAYSFD